MCFKPLTLSEVSFGWGEGKATLLPVSWFTHNKRQKYVINCTLRLPLPSFRVSIGIEWAGCDDKQQIPNATPTALFAHRLLPSEPEWSIWRSAEHIRPKIIYNQARGNYPLIGYKLLQAFCFTPNNLKGALSRLLLYVQVSYMLLTLKIYRKFSR
jgi:hypothetical protein